MKRLDSIAVIDRFAPLRVQLLKLLADFCEDDWARPTAAKGWTVKGVAAHLVGGDIGILSRRRDAFHQAGTAPANYRELVALINRLNEEWVVASRRISPRLLCELLAFIGPLRRSSARFP